MQWPRNVHIIAVAFGYCSTVVACAASPDSQGSTTQLETMTDTGMDADGDATSTSTTSISTSTPTPTTTSTTGGPPDSTGDAGGDTTGSPPGGSSTMDGDSGTTADPSTGSDEAPMPVLPTPVGPCPQFTNSTLTFAPAQGQREARIWIDPDAAAAMDGPVVFYWYGTGGQPPQAVQALGAGIEAITALGGIVVAPLHTNGGSFPWLESPENDFALTDEILGCADQSIGVDARQIHSLGFSAGGLFTTGLSYERSRYLASVVTYSGGGSDGAQFEDPTNRFASLVFYGGAGDNVFGFDFQDSSLTWHQALLANGNFAALCNHGGGHVMPSQAGLAVVQFFLDHPFGTDPSPYAVGFPAGIPEYCALP